MRKVALETIIVSAVLSAALNISVVQTIDSSPHNALSTIGPAKVVVGDKPQYGAVMCGAVMAPPKSSSYGYGWPFIYQFSSSDCVWAYSTHSTFSYVLDWATTWVILFVTLCGLFSFALKLSSKPTKVTPAKK